MNQKPLSYRDAGVDIDRGNRLVERIKHLAKATHRPELLGGVGGFGALFEIPVQRYRRPVLVSGADGVGTKLRLAISCGEHGTVGIDLVAMCVNDVLVHGAEPLYFLDYFATGRLDENVAEQVISGIARGCKLAGAALAGGETAEMPGMYADGDYDLAGFCVGVVEKDDIIDGRRVAPGDALIGIASSGPHSNGYSLIRKVLERSATPIETPINGSTLRELLLEPTRIYVSSVRAVSGEFPVHAVAHVTGGGLVENLPRVLPGGVAAEIDTGAWPRPAIFDWLQQTGSIEDAEMWRTFNCGIGMVLCVPSECVGAARALLEKAGERTWHIGEVVRSAQPEARVILR